MPEVETSSGSLSDHEAEFSPRRGQVPVQPGPTPEAPTADLDADAKEAALEAEATASDPMRQYRDQEEKPQRHRARSQQASAEDVPEIKKLTADLRAKEAELIKARPDEAKTSPRLVALRRQIRGIEAELADLQPKAETRVEAPKVTPAERREATVEAPKPFDKPKPTIASLQAAGSADPYADLPSAVQDWYDEKRAHDQLVKDAEASKQREIDEQETAKRTFAQRRDAFAATHPDLMPLLTQRKAEGYDLSRVMTAAIMTDVDNGPAMLHALVRNPDVLDDLSLSTWETQVNDTSVVAMRRKLSRLVQAGTTGAAAQPAREPRTPRPPTPVRTGPLKTGDEPPDDGASLASHEQFYSRKRRR